MTNILTSASTQSDTKEVLRAYLDVLTLAEPIQARLWQEDGVTVTQLLVLRELRRGPQTPGRLGQALGLAPASVTRLLDRLERRGLVSRHRELEDRRSVEVHLEPVGERLLGEIRVLRGTDLHRAVESMTADERRRLAAALRQLVERTRSIAAADPAAP